MSGAIQPITIQLGETYDLTVDLTSLGEDLSTWTFEGTVRDQPLPDGTVIASFTADMAQSASGVIVMSLAALDPSLSGSAGVYQLRWTKPTDDPFTFAYGPVTFTAQIQANS